VIGLTPLQVKNAEQEPSGVPVMPTDTLTGEPNVHVEVFGGKLIQGLRVIGLRETRMVRVRGVEPPAQMIHEVWVSPDLQLTLQVIDGDPRKLLTISGLDHVLLHVEESEFQPVPGYSPRIYPKDTRGLAGNDINQLSFWFVRSFSSDE
jgi:hypothetical protein